MFLFRLAAWLLSLPILWAGQLAAILKLPASVPLLEAAWWVGGDGRVAVAALSNRKLLEPTEAIRARAAQWLARRPCPHVAGYAGILALTENDMDTARQMLARGRDLGNEPEGILDMLELFVAVRSGDEGVVDELVRRWSPRRDLPPTVCEVLLTKQLSDAMFRQDWPDAQRRAKQLWSIRNHPGALTAFWAIDRQKGKNWDLGRALQQMGISPPESLCHKTDALIALGAIGEAEQSIGALRETSPAMADRACRFLQRQKEKMA